MLEVPLLNLKYSNTPAILCVSIASAKVLFYLDVINCWIDVPVSIKPVAPHSDAIPPDEDTCSHWRNHTYAIQPVPNPISVSDINRPRAIYEVKSVEIWQFEILFWWQGGIVHVEPVWLFENWKYLIKDAEKEFSYGCCPESFLIDACLKSQIQL